MWPPDEDLLTAWRRLVADPTTAGAFAELVLRPLEADLRRYLPWAKPDDVTDAADWAVAAFLRKPTAFDPDKGPLPAFLRMAARRDLANLSKREERHHRGRIPWDGVELTHPAGNDSEGDLSLEDHPALRAAIAALNETDRRVLELILDRERATDVFAVVLGITDRPADEQEAIVKREKDRIKVRLKRAGRGP